MYCKCGCGQVTTIAKRNQRGIRKGEHVDFIHGHHLRAKWAGRQQYVEEDRGFDTPCWIWQGYIHVDNGYGEISRVNRAGRTRAAHRAFYEEEYGPIPDGHRVHHRCEVRACVRPTHLEAVSKEEHGLRHSKVTDEQVREMRRRNAAGEPVTKLAKEFGLAYQYAWFVVRGHRRASA